MTKLDEIVTYHHIEPGAGLDIHEDGGTELLVMKESVSEGTDSLERGGWLRSPDGERLHVTAGLDGATIWMKTGHLRHVASPR